MYLILIDAKIDINAVKSHLKSNLEFFLFLMFPINEKLSLSLILIEYVSCTLFIANCTWSTLKINIIIYKIFSV